MTRSRTVKIADGGKLVIPARFRRALGMGVGDTVVVEIDGGEPHVRSLSAAIRLAQGIVGAFVPEGTSLADQIIADRRAASADRVRSLYRMRPRCAAC